MSGFQILIRLLVALILGGLVGLERGAQGRAAGFRTHILVCMGSALIMMTSMHIFEIYKARAVADPGRIAAQVVSGIGFLGAGTILRFRKTIRGLTTAASLWAVAGIGLAVGSGFYFAAILTVIFALVTLEVFSKLEKKLAIKRPDFTRKE